MQYPVLTGCIRSVSAISNFGDPNRSQKVHRKIKIENLDGNVIELTLWDEMAEHFEQAEIQNMEQPVIIAVSSCRVSKYIDYQLAATPATYYYLNPKIPKADESRVEYKPKYETNLPLQICKFPYEDADQEKIRNRFMLNTLLQQNPGSYTRVRFTSEAAIIGNNTNKDWYYISCTQCSKKAINKDGNYRCLDHGPQPGPAYRYNFKCYITDPTATAPLTFITPTADRVTWYTRSELVEKYKPTDPKQTPPEILTVQGQSNVFQFHSNTLGNVTDLTLDDVFINKKQMKAQAAYRKKTKEHPHQVKQWKNNMRIKKEKANRQKGPSFQPRPPTPRSRKETKGSRTKQATLCM